MRILVNGASRETQSPDIETVLVELGYTDTVVATALNGEFVPVNSRHVTQLADGDRLEVLAPMQGG